MTEDMTEDVADAGTYTLQLTRKQLAHLRDILSMRLPPRYVRTISACLAKYTKRAAPEAKLWQAVYELCNEAKLATDEDAPDYTLWQVSQPKLEVIKLNPEDIEE